MTATIVASQSILMAMYHPAAIGSHHAVADTNAGIFRRWHDRSLTYQQYSTMLGQVHSKVRLLGHGHSLTKWLEAFKELHNLPDADFISLIFAGSFGRGKHGREA